MNTEDTVWIFTNIMENRKHDTSTYMSECRFDLRILPDHLENGWVHCFYNAPDDLGITKTELYNSGCEADSSTLYVITDLSVVNAQENDQLKNILYLTRRAANDLDYFVYKKNIVVYISDDSPQNVVSLAGRIRCDDFRSYLHNRLLNLTVQNNITAFLNQIAHILGNPVVVHDTSFRILYESSNIEKMIGTSGSGFCKTEYLSSYTIDFIKREIKYDSDCQAPVIIERQDIGKRLIHCPIYSDNILIAVVNILELNTVFSNDTLELTELFCKYFGLIIKDDKRFLYSMGILHEQFFKDLLAETTNDNHFLTRRASDLGLTFEKYNYVGIIIHKGRNLSVSKIFSIAADLNNILNIKLCTNYQSQILILLSHDQPEALTDTQLTDLNAFLSRSSLTMVISHSFKNIQECRMHYHQALNLFRSVSTLDNNRNRILLFNDNLISQLLMYSEQNIPRNEVISHKLLFYSEYDRQHNTEFVLTIKEYVRNLMHINDTAAALNIHKNTLFYRLKKIQELYPIDFEDHEVLFQLMLSFKVQEIIRNTTENK